MSQSSPLRIRERLVSELLNTELFRDYQSAFQSLTGMTLKLEAAGEDHPVAGDATIFSNGAMEGSLLPVRIGKTLVASLGIQAEEKRGVISTANEVLHAALVLMQSFAFQLGECASRFVFARAHYEPEAVRAAKSYILKHLTDPMTLEQVAAHVHVSPFHFCKIFKRSTGTTFTDFVNRVRIDRARRMLMQPGARITDVAYDVGFQSLSHFNRSFRRIAGETPSEFRQAIRMRPMASLLAA